jgi:hypothetical protein
LYLLELYQDMYSLSLFQNWTKFYILIFTVRLSRYYNKSCIFTYFQSRLIFFVRAAI